VNAVERHQTIMKSLSSILTPPVLCAALLGGIALEKSRHLKPSDAAAYHARVHDAVLAMEPIIGDREHGLWAGKDIEPQKAAVQLLRPNVILSRRYTDTSSESKTYGNHCDVLIVQCWNSRDMVGHFPKNCYPNAGETLIREEPRDWKIDGRLITGTEYTFERYSRGQPTRRVVYNFLFAPGQGIVRDIKGVNKAAEDYQWRHFGAAQFQFVMDDALSREVRDEIFATLMGNDLGVLDALKDLRTK
jgi:hypothetical protein